MEVIKVINKYSDVPLYAQLKDIIIQKIEFGEYAENGQIPSEHELCTMYDISRPTVRQAISELTSSGYLKKEKGRGTFVCSNNTALELKNYSGFQDSLLEMDTYQNKRLISTKTINHASLEKEIALCFDCSTNNYSEIAEIKYNLIEKNEIVALITSYIPLNLFPTIINDISENKRGQDILMGRYPLVPAKAKTCIEVAFCSVKDAADLHIQPGNPLIKISNQILSKNSSTVEYVVSKYRTDLCKLLYETSK